jgi:chromate transporter
VIDILLTLAGRFVVLSLFAVGGGVSILIPQIHQEFVHQYHLLNERTFAELIAVAQASPGPNFLLMPLIGFRVASWPGAFVGLIAFMAVPLVLALTAGRILHDHENETIRMLRRAFRPLTSGMWIASGIVIALAVDRGVTGLAFTIAVAACALFVETNPLWFCLGAGVIGALLGS